ncbi:UNVERIFIED_CONTAM: hypothetical protein FKN15_016149 [Acipenser sinensis]
MLTVKSAMELQSSSLEMVNELSSLDDLTISDKANSTGYPDYVYFNAATIFQNNHVEKPQDQRLVDYGKLTNLPMPAFEDEKSQRWSFELAFNALKYQDFLEDLMIDSCFYPSNPTHDDLTSLVVVMLYDFQDRKFQPRLCLADEEEIEEVREVEKCLNSFKTKIAASLARCRIKLDILTIDYLLPETCTVSGVSNPVEFILNENRDIKLIPDNFTDIEPTDARLQKAKIVLLLPQCTVSGVSNPVEFILNENRVPRVQAVVYCTCSVYPEENENVVKKALEYKVEGNQVQPYRLSPPVLPLCSTLEIEKASEKCLKLEPSEINNGCFVAVLTREDPSGTVSVKDVLARAAAKGLLDGIKTIKPAKKERRKSKPATQTTIASSGTQDRIAEFLKKESKEATNIVIKPYISNDSLFRESKTRISNPPKRLPKATPSMSKMSPVKKILSKSSATERHYERRRSNVARPKLEEMSVLKPVEMILPPVICRSHSSYGCNSKSPPHLSYFRWKGRHSLPRNLLTPTSSTKMSKHNDPPTSPAKPSRPWL